MKIIRFFKIFAISEQKVPLGRWGINTCQNKVNTKVDLSNEDHCGPCSYTPKKDNNEFKDKVKEETNKIHVKNEVKEETNKIPFSSLFVIFSNK
jgi:hypothetical protein